MGLRNFAQSGCGITDGLMEMYKLKLAQQELAQEGALKAAQANLYKAQADHLRNNKGRGRGGGGGGGDTAELSKLFNPDGSVNTKVLGKGTPAATKNNLLNAQALGQDSPLLNTALSGLKGITTQAGGSVPPEANIHFNTPQEIYTNDAMRKAGAAGVKSDDMMRMKVAQFLLQGGDINDAAAALNSANTLVPKAAVPGGGGLPPRLPGETFEQYKARTGL